MSLNLRSRLAACHHEQAWEGEQPPTIGAGYIRTINTPLILFEKTVPQRIGKRINIGTQTGGTHPFDDCGR